MREEGKHLWTPPILITAVGVRGLIGVNLAMPITCRSAGREETAAAEWTAEKGRWSPEKGSAGPY